MRAPFLPCLAALAACALVPDTPRAAPAWVVDAAGIGPVGTGVTLRQLSATLGEEVRADYPGRVRDEPHHYDGPVWRYLIVEPPGDTLHRLVFETDGQRMRSYRAGRRPAVDYVEGCA